MYFEYIEKLDYLKKSIRQTFFFYNIIILHAKNVRVSMKQLTDIGCKTENDTVITKYASNTVSHLQHIACTATNY